METTNWLNEETKNLKESSYDGERLPALKLEEKKITTISIDTSKPFEKWVDQEKGTVKKILPCIVNAQQYVWWLNVRNPIYGEIIMRSTKVYPNPLVIKVLQTGSKQDTKYNIVEE